MQRSFEQSGGWHAFAAPKVVAIPREPLGAAKACHPMCSTLGTSVSRPGFTLLEMLLATVISALLMGAVYVAMDLQIRQAQIGREVVEQGTLVHNVLARMSRDIKQCVTPAAAVLPTSLSLATLSQDTSTPATGTSSAGTPSGSADSGSATAGPSTDSANSSSSSTASSPSLLPTRDTIQFQLGVQGGPNTLTLYISRLPHVNEARPPIGIRSDLRLVSYWLATDGSTPLGLAWRELEQVTGEQANSTSAAANGAVEGATIIAPEVVSLQFRYFDGTSWLETWDGSQTGADYLTPIGPPLAIEITLGIVVPSSDNRFGGQPSVRLYRHVVPILTADGVPRTGV